MAVIQVGRLKNPCRLWMWNNLVAAQPPNSAPMMPITQVRMRPCDLPPGISILASKPAPRPRTIQAMIPITDSLVSDQMRYVVVSHAGQIAVGEEFSQDSRRPLVVASCRHRPMYPQKKIRALLCHPRVLRVQRPGSGA